MAESVVSVVVEKISDLLIEEGKLLYGVRGEVEDLKTELSRMQCFLKDADASLPDADHRLRNWVSEIKDLAYMAENVLEIFVVQVESRREGRGIKKIVRRFSSIFSEALARHRVVTEIRSIKAKISKLTQSLQIYGIKAIVAEGETSKSSNRWLRQSYPYLSDEHFVGMGEDLEKLISYLLDGGKQYTIVSLWGMGGLGKTTLAKKVYNHMDIRLHFDSFAWVCITQQCKPKQVWQDVLKALLPTISAVEIDAMGDYQLVEQLRKVQEQRKCLVVLDDLWTVEGWESLIPAFPIDKAGHSKLLITTRTKNVAKKGYLYELGSLDEEEGWELLQKKAFHVEDYTPGQISSTYTTVFLQLT